jgi:hypothetical protein
LAFGASMSHTIGAAWAGRPIESKAAQAAAPKVIFNVFTLSLLADGFFF